MGGGWGVGGGGGGGEWEGEGEGEGEGSATGVSLMLGHRPDTGAVPRETYYFYYDLYMFKILPC